MMKTITLCSLRPDNNATGFSPVAVVCSRQKTASRTRTVIAQAAKKPRQGKGTPDELPSDAEVVPLIRVNDPDGYAESVSATDKRFDGLKAVVAGATGKTGQAIVQQLRARGVPVKALVRDLGKAADIFPLPTEDLQFIKADVFQFSSLRSTLEGSKVLFIATGTQPSRDPLGPFTVDYSGTVNLVTAAQQQGIRKVVLVTSIGVDDNFFPLNLFFGVLFWKKRAEESLQRSGLNYTIVRPGGLLDSPRNSSMPGNIILAGPDVFGLPPRRRWPGSILRSQVAEICVEAAVEPAASFKVVEAIADTNAPRRLLSDLFAAVL